MYQIRKRFGAFERQQHEAFQSFVMIAFPVNKFTMSIEGDVRSVVCYWFTFPRRRSLVLSTSAAHMSPVVMLLSRISLPGDIEVNEM